MRLLVISSVLGVSLVSVCFGAEITGISYEESVDVLRLKVTASDYISVQASLLDGPNQLIIHFPGTRISGALPQPPQDHPLFSGVSGGSEGNGDLRLVIDLKQPATFTQFWEPVSYENSARFSIDFPKAALAERAGRGSGVKGAGKTKAVLMPAGKKVASGAANASELDQLRRALAEQQRIFENQKKVFQEQQQKLQLLQNQVERLAGRAPARPASASPSAVQITRAENPSPGAVKAVDKKQPSIPTGPVGQAPESKPKPPELPRISETVGGVLTPKGKVIVEPSLEYNYANNNRVFLDAFTFIPAIAIGLIDLREVDRHTFIGAITGRYGLTDRLEVSGRVPFLYREDTQRSRAVSIGAGVDETFNADGSGLGDLEFTARYQFNGGAGGWPIFVGNLAMTVPTGKSPYDVDFVLAQGVPGARFPTELPTGSGYVSVQPSITALYPTDPAVFYASLSYGYNMETDENIGTVDPGDSIGGSFGLGFSINERSSFSIGYSHKHVLETDVDGTSVPGSSLDIGEFLLGYAFKLTRDTSLNLSVSLGATDDAPDVRLTLRLPMSFSPFQ
ncbi:transporter [Methylocaldum sp.]|uniref:transporter n=1 Tax=Methylocaldum sp. TaxID=1969727 RepID=UPI002D42EA12|nr:transporter [Methylocaldum sp.]HYE35310.1 transporter [Methylocaldum sp.]